ncbi:hypothetical protein HYE54_12335 [Aggregatibacter actinomycetemcomitans]|uniref:tetratricopeptide repeat protein n=1 Tax=Aggregatibacter actinomycetemcomitans TaxID=714 RepID=UPI00197B7F89|nr:tetratricopeptide repeat protein [Aggregatibacter actinomycetemcomitans]MBN6069483.1 hypothetical protein [Aggregatibacter actinomycetemcomitans]MBN6087055.1 hypothetical protein [Aggregatibacter actinomycetemcomitans]
MKKSLLVFFSMVICPLSFSKDIYENIYNLDESYYGKNFPTASNISIPQENISVDITYKENGYEHFSGSEHTIYTKSVLIKYINAEKKILFKDVAYKNNKNYLTLCRMDNGNKLLSHTEVFQGIEFSELWIGFNINLYEIIENLNGKDIIPIMDMENKFNMDNKYWVPLVEKDKPSDGRDFYPFYNEGKTLNRLIEMRLCSNILSPEEFKEKIKNGKKLNFDMLYLYNQLLLYPLDADNLVSYNNSAFYLEQQGKYDLSIYLLKNIIKKYPDRVVAYINLGDAYWGKGDINNAIEIYHEYIRRMNDLGKQKNIPNRVINRTEDIYREIDK